MSDRAEASLNAQGTLASESRWFRRLAALLFAWLVLVLAFASLEPSLSRLTSHLRYLQSQSPATRSSPAYDDVGLRTSPIPCSPAASSATAPASGKTTAPLAKPTPVARREIGIDLRDGGLQIERSADLERCGEDMTRLRAAMGRWLPDEVENAGLRYDIFGGISVDGASLRFSVPRLVVDGDDRATATVADSVTVAGTPARKDGEAYDIQVRGGLNAAATRVIVKYDEGTILWSQTPPRRASTEESEWTIVDEPYWSQTLRVFPQAKTVAERSVDEKRPPSEPLLIRAVGGRLDLLRPLWLGITYVLPFLAILWWIGRYRPAPGGGPDVLAPLVAGSHAAAALIGVLVAVETAEYVSRLDSKTLREGIGLQNLWWSSAVLKGAMLGLVWPLFANGITRPRVGRSGVVAAVLGALLLAAIFLAIRYGDAPHLDALYQFARSSASRMGKSEWDEELLLYFFVALGLALLFSAWGVTRALVGGSVAMVLCLVLGAAVLLTFEQSIHGGGPYRSLIAVVAALPFGWAFARVSRCWIPAGDSRARDLAGSVGFLVFGAGVAALLAAPVDLETSWSHSWLLGSTVWALARLWELPALVLLVCWLARRGAVPDVATAADDRRALQGAGALLVFTVFYWRPQQAWLPLIAAALVGAPLLAWWLFKNRPPIPGRPGGASLVEIYNLGTLAAWSSSLAIAIGAASATALAGQAGSLFTAGLKVLLPDLQPPR